MSNSEIQAAISSEVEQNRITHEVCKEFAGLQIDENMTPDTEPTENADYYSEDDYWDEYDSHINDCGCVFPRVGHSLKNGKLLEKRGSNQEKFTSLRPKSLIKYGKRAISPQALQNDVDVEAKLIIKEMVEKYCYFKVINDAICCGERSVLIHCSGRLDTVTGKPLEFLIKVYRLQFGLERIKEWASKECQNKSQMFRHVNAPNIYYQTKNVTVLDFIGDNGVPAPSLSEAPFEITDKMYSDVVSIMYKLYNEAHMVHGKLSARTILWWRNKLWLISLSHGVSREHSDALLMLMKDCCHITQFFKRKSVLKVKSIMNLFKHITGLDVIDPRVLKVLKHTRTPVKHRLKKSKQPQEGT